MCIHIYTHLHIYIYIYTHIKLQVVRCFFLLRKCKQHIKTCSYIQSITLNLIKSIQNIVFDTRHTNHTKSHFQSANSFEQTYFQIVDIHSNQRFPFICMVRVWRA